MMKKTLKRTTVAVAALSLAVSGIPTTAFPQSVEIVNASVDGEIFEAGNFRYKVTGKNTEAILLGFTEGATEKTTISIPETVNYDDYDFPVVSIAGGAFENCTTITSIVFTDKDGKEINKTNLTTIGQDTFLGCTGLTTVTLAEGVTTIGSNTFRDCTNLTTVNLPTTITTVDDNLYDDSPFVGCTGLQKVTFAEGTKVIPNLIFKDCEFITTAHFSIPSTITTVGAGAFQGLTKLENIDFLPQGVTTIGQEAFGDCTGLTSAQMPTSLTTIGSNSFKGCFGLTEVTIPKSLTKIDDNLYDKSPFTECTNLKKVVFEEGMQTIPAYTLNGASSVKEVILPETVTAIGEASFAGLGQLKTITLPSNLQSIGISAFSDCSSLTGITFPETLTTIGSNSFLACNRLTEVTLPKTLTKVEDNLYNESPFAKCENLKKVVFEEVVCSLLGRQVK